MNAYPYLDYVIYLAALTAILVVTVFVIRYYSLRSRALNKRLSDIVKIRKSSNAESLVKNTKDYQYDYLADNGFLNQLMENLNLFVLRSGLQITALTLVVITSLFFFTPLLSMILLTKISIYQALILSLCCGALPVVYVSKKVAQRSEKIETQLPEALDFICRSLRAGHSLVVSFGMLGNEQNGPINEEFKAVFEEINFGLAFNVAVSNLALRVNNNDLNFFVVGLLIQRDAGGNLIELLENLSNTIRERMLLKGKIRVLSAEGKYSGVLLSVLPFLLGFVLSLVNPGYMDLLWTTEQGQKLIMIALMMLLFGGFLMWKITQVKV